MRNIRRFRSEGKKIYYLDETWVNAGHKKERVWQDTTVKSKKQAFLNGLSTGLKAPSGKGGRLIIIHAGSKDGFVNGALEIFKEKKNGDYHNEMNGAHFEDWFVYKLHENIDANSVIIMDNAPYHSVRVEKIPTSSSKKEDIQAWLSEKNIPWNRDMLKVELLKLVSENKKYYEAYRIDEIAAERGHTVLRLPPYHCELNPIENIWGEVKNYVAQHNQTFKLDEIARLTLEGIEKASNSWDNCVEHVINDVETCMWKLDNIEENLIENVSFTINTGDSDDPEQDDNLSGI